MYHGPNQTITVVGGQITWRYWLRRVRHVSPDDSPDGEAAEGKSISLPCRILIELKGLEWFIYNRSPQFDWVLDEMTAAAGTGEGGRERASHSPVATRGPDDDEDGKQTPRTGSTTLAPRRSPSEKESPLPLESFEDIVAKSPYLKILPVKLDCHRGAVIMGNNNTPSLVVAYFDKAHVLVDARKVDTPLKFR